jgi:hypothetical protein
MGLLGGMARFQHHMVIVVNCISNVIIYIDNLLVHSATHEEHLVTLDQVLQSLVQHNIKMNLQYCAFGSKRVVTCLYFWLSEEGRNPGSNIFKAVKNAQLLANAHEESQFLGLSLLLHPTNCSSH